MKNLIPKDLTMHHKFDLKGSTYKRKASRKERAKANPTYKDLDFNAMYPEGILLQPELYNSLMDTIERDCRALESLQIMDYSFLMGIHNVDNQNVPLMTQMKNRFFGESEPSNVPGGGEESDDSDGGRAGGERRKPPMLERIGSFQQRQRLIAHSTALESITAEVDEVTMADMIDETDTAHIMSTYGGIPAKNHKGENLLIFIGIIDILQTFGVAKKLEHAWKSLVHDGDTVSVHRPSFYAARFKKYLAEDVFRKMPPNLKPALSFRRSQGHYKRAVSRDVAEERPREAAGRAGAEGAAGGGGVTVITIGGQEGRKGEGGGILPAVLRDKPRLSTVSPPARTQVSSGRPDVADVVAAACTPPPADTPVLAR